MDTLSQSYPLDFDVAEGFLHMAKHSSGSGEVDFYVLQLAQYMVPLIYNNLLLSAGYRREDIPEAIFPVRGQGQYHIYCFHHPHQEKLEGGTGAVPCIYLLEVQVFLSV